MNFSPMVGMSADKDSTERLWGNTRPIVIVGLEEAAMAKVFLPKGTRDLMPATMNRRLMVINTVREVFARYGFEPLETPAFERIETLTGKYGDEGEKLMFRILKRGEGGKRGEVDPGPPIRPDRSSGAGHGDESGHTSTLQALSNSACVAR